MNSSTHNMMDSHNHMNHQNDPVKQKEHMDLMNLSSNQNLNNPVVAINNGSWFDSNTWKDGKVPGDGDDVVISEGVTVIYDDISEARLNIMRVDGKLEFADNQDTKLILDSFFVSSQAELSIGTKDNPIQADKTARIIFTSDKPIDTQWDKKQLSRGLVSHGKVDVFGADKTDFLTLESDVLAGANELILSKVPQGWKVGDRIVVGGTQYNYDGSDEDNSRFQDEVLTITEINGNRVKFTNNDISSGDNTVLRFDHKRPDIPEKDQLNLYVANTSRNVSFETENADNVPLSQRGHVMFMHNPDVRVYNAGFYGLGRTDKSKPIDDIGTNVDGSPGGGTNIRSRYSLHFHRAGSEDINGIAAYAKGNAIVDSPGWGIVHHDSHGIIEDNVVFDVVGSGIITESGNEIGAWRNNITIKTVGFSGDRDALNPDSPRVLNFDFGFDGEGYWVQGASAIAIEDNIAISAAGGGINIYGGNDGGESVRDKKFIKVKNLPEIYKDIAKGTDDETIVDVGAVPIQLSGFESYNSRDGIFSWGKVRNDDGQLDTNFDSEGLIRPAHEYISTLSDFKLWNIYEKGIVLFYNNNFEFKDGLIVGDSTDPDFRHGMGIFTNHASKEEIFDNLTIKRFKEGVSVPLDAGKDFIASQLKNSSFSEIDNVFVSKEPPPPKDNSLGELEDFPSYFKIYNTEFAPVEGNLAPTPIFQTQGIGGYAVQLDASASFDEDTNPKFKNQPSKGIVAYGWDLNNDGNIDKFGRILNYYFDEAGSTDITLTVWDDRGATNTITQTIDIQQTAYKNPFINGDFSSKKLGEDYQADSTGANNGWFGTSGVKQNSAIGNGGAIVLSGQFGAGLSQIIYDNQITRGLQTLGFTLKNTEGGSKSWQQNQIFVTLYGIYGEFENNLYNTDGPIQVGVLPMTSVQLKQESVGGSEFDWTKFSWDIDLGTGYDYLMFQVNTSAADDKGDFIAIDDVELVGEGLPIVTPKDEILPENSTTIEPENSTPEQPQNPNPTQPENSTPEQPQNPIPTQPENSTTIEPENSTPEQPQNPIPTQPENSTPEQPQNPIPTQPENSTPEELDNSNPIELENSTPEEPDNSNSIELENSTPEEPENLIPTQPENSTPEEPKNPIPEEPKNSVPEEPQNPIPTQPENPTPEEPDNFTPEEPKNPTPEQPQNPTPEEPDNSNPTEPENSTPEESQNPNPTQPENSNPTEPENPNPTESDNSNPTEPENSIPTQPDNSTPEEPKNPIPEEPKNSVPEKPQNPIPTQPENPTPEEPDNFTPEEPDNFTPEEPKNPTPEQPQNPTPEEPDNSNPTEPENSTPEESQNPNPTQPENSNPTEPQNPIPTQPENSNPTKPQNPNPTEPENSTPKEPENSNPIELENSTPEEPQNPIPTQPENSTPKEPQNSTPKEPENSNPIELENSTPEEPQNPIPTQPENSTPKEPQNSTPKEPENPTTIESKNPIPTQPENSTPKEPQNSTPKEPENPTTIESKNPIPTQPENSTPKEPQNTIPKQAQNPIPTQPENPTTVEPENPSPVEQKNPTLIEVDNSNILLKPDSETFTQNNGFFTKNLKKNLKINIDKIESKNINEIGLFVVDDENGNINGIAPNYQNYRPVALERAQILFSTISNIPNGFKITDIQRILEFDSQTRFGFYMIPNSTTDTVIAELTKNGTTNSSVFFSNSSNIKINQLDEENFSLKWSEQPNNQNFTDITLNLQLTQNTPNIGTELQTKSQQELIDLRPETSSISINVDVYREAEYDNIIGFYQITNSDGGIDINGDGLADINPGEQGYKQAALNNRITTIDFLKTENQTTTSYDGILEGGSIIAPFMIVDGTLEQALNDDAEVYFSQLGANPNNVDSIRLLGDNIFGFEDSPIDGDFDYNDIIFQVNFN